MPMTPKKGESQSEWMSRCVPDLKGDGKRPTEQAVAACLDIWRSTGHKAPPPPDKKAKPTITKYAEAVDPPDPENEDHQQFIDRCTLQMTDVNPDMDESEAEQECNLMWEEETGGDEERKLPQIVQKMHAAPPTVDREFILSDETPDRLGDIIKSDGWNLENFQKNPVALFNHNANHVIGTWKNLRVEKGGLRGKLELAPKGTSPRIDEIRKLVEAGILRAVSVGFRPLAHEPRSKTGNPATDMFGGMIFLKSELVETSLVSIPANPNALAIMKSLDISPATMRVVLAEQGNKEQRAIATGLHAEQGKPTSDRKTTIMTPLSKRIEEMQQSILADKDKLTEHLKGLDDSNVSDSEMEITNALSAQLTQKEKQLVSLKEAEKHLAGTSETTMPAPYVAKSNGGGARPFALSPKKFDPLEYIVRTGVVAMYSHQNKVNQEVALQHIAREYPGYGEEATRAYVDYVSKAAVNPAMTTVSGWAAELVNQVNAELMNLLQPKSVYPRLSGMGLSLSFGRNGRINIPTRSATPTIAGSFIGEGQPIPVRRGAFTAQVLTPKKMGVITTWTRELDTHSIPAIEGLLRDAIRDDTATAIDSILLDTNAATAVRPAGLRNGVSTLTPTSGGGFNALVGDIKAMTGALLTATAGNIRTMVWLMNPQQVLSISLTQAPSVAGMFPFAAEVQAGNLRGYPIIESATVPAGTVIALDAADFVSVGGDAPRFEISDQATIHEEDTAPAAIASGSPGTVASPVRSLWQTDSLALRMIVPLNWTLRRTGMITYTTGVTW
jgi:HK97 family phage prohead protease/HK97 family phage major capsid protein